MDNVLNVEYARLIKIFQSEGISIKEPRVGALHFPVYADIMNESIDVLNLSTRPYNALRRQKIELLSEIPPSAELRRYRNLGSNSINEIMDKLFEYHYYRLNISMRHNYLMGIAEKYQ